MPRTRLLWVEDETESGMVERKACIEFGHNYDLMIKRNATEAESAIQENAFDKICFDIRIPPGYGTFWEEEFNNYNRKMGLDLIERVMRILKTKHIYYGICTIERWEDIRDRILHADKDFKPDIQYLHKVDIVYPEDFEEFIHKLNY